MAESRSVCRYRLLAQEYGGIQIKRRWVEIKFSVRRYTDSYLCNYKFLLVVAEEMKKIVAAVQLENGQKAQKLAKKILKTNSI